MQIGWIDYSREERNKIVSILHMLETQNALDELGIGTVRDGFSDRLFPGISTLQTRAKYFVLIPYLFALAQRQHFQSRREVLRYINGQEEKLIQTLIQNSSPSARGIIGSRNRHVKVKPSSIYWSGLRTLGILLRPGLSLDDACEITMINSQRRKAVVLKAEDTDSAADDADALAGGIVIFSPVIPGYDVMREADIELTRREAKYLYDHFSTSPGTSSSLTTYLLKHELSCSSFDAIPGDLLPKRLAHDVRLAQDFAEFIYGAHLLYNLIYAESSGIQDDDTRCMEGEFEDWLDRDHRVDLDDVFLTSRCPDKTRQFLTTFDRATMDRDIKSARELVINRELAVKHSRAKLKHPEQYRYERPIHHYKLDYRFGTARTIVADIRRGLEQDDGT